MASKLGGHSLIRDPPLRKVGGPLIPGPPRIAATLGTRCHQSVSLCAGDPGPHLKLAYLGLTRIHPKRHLDRFIRFGRAHGRDYTDAQTLGQITTLRL